MASAIGALVSLVLVVIVSLAAKVWGWQAIGLGALGLLVACAAILLVAGWRERRARKERGGPTEWTARRWEREHVNGRQSWVQEVPYREGHYWLGVSPFGETSVQTFGTLEEVRRQADAASECPQPCACPGWARVSRPIRK